MQNAMNTDKNQKWNNVKNQAESAVTDAKNSVVADVKNLDISDLREAATEITSKVRDASTNLYNDSIGFVKRYPISSALGLAAVSFLFGKMSARRK